METSGYYSPDVCAPMYDPCSCHAHARFGLYTQPMNQQRFPQMSYAGQRIDYNSPCDGKFKLICKPQQTVRRVTLCHANTTLVTKNGVYRNIPCSFTRNNGRTGGRTECTMQHFTRDLPAVAVWEAYPCLCPFELMTGRCNMGRQCSFIHCLDHPFGNDDEHADARAAFMQYWKAYGAVCLQSDGQKAGQKAVRTVKPYSSQEKIQQLQALFEDLKPLLEGSVPIEAKYNTLVTIADEYNERSMTFVLLCRFLEQHCTDTELAHSIMESVATNNEASVAHLQDAIVHAAKRLSDTQNQDVPLARAYGTITSSLFSHLMDLMYHSTPDVYEREIANAMLEIFSHVMDMGREAMSTRTHFMHLWQRINMHHQCVLQLPSVARSPIITCVMGTLTMQ